MLDNPRIRLVVGRYGRQLMIGLAVLGVVAFALGGWFAVSTTAATVTQQAHQQQVETTATHSAVVTGDDDLWAPGTELRDQPVYLLNATPTVTVEATTAVEGAETATVDHTWTLTVAASRNGETFWSNTTVLAVDGGEGTTVRSNVTVDVRTVTERIARAQQQVGTAGTVSATLTLTVEYATGDGGPGSYEGAEERSVPLEVTGDAYTVGDGLGWETSHSTPVTQEVTQPRDRTYPAALFAVGVLSLGVAGAVYRRDPEAIDLDRARDELHREQYAHWISPGSLPFDLDQEFVELESLEDVVDVAIDTQERVVHDRRRDLFAVISENVVYYHSIGGHWTETAFPGFGRSGDGRPGDEDGDGRPGDEEGVGEATGGGDFGFGDLGEEATGPGDDGGSGSAGEFEFEDDRRSGSDDRFEDGD